MKESLVNGLRLFEIVQWWAYLIHLLVKLKNDGYLIKGIHYNQLGDNNSPFYWNVEKTLEAFENWGAPIK